MSGSSFSVEIQPRIPGELARLKELAGDLTYSWDRQVRGLFARLDTELWDACGHNPTVFLRQVPQEALNSAASDQLYLEQYNRALSGYDSYVGAKPGKEVTSLLDPSQELIAYFCAEFGFHESFPIYSGGLGILAGDHCKAASDLVIPFIAVGLLYRQGYFNQTIDGDGQQIARRTTIQFKDLPVEPALDPAGNELHVTVDLPGRVITLKVWQARAGHIRLYLLDSDLPMNQEPDRGITRQLYGGDSETRIQQEIVLGVGGVRALRALVLEPTAWHINEGHAAFQILERIREYVGQGMSSAGALERVAAGTIFTTHTPVPAGHDIFSRGQIEHYFDGYLDQLEMDLHEFLALGETPTNNGGFNMTSLALRGSRFHNGVSRIHGSVAARMEGYVWPQIPARENPLRYVTNGVHVMTFMAQEWLNLLDSRFREWRNELLSVKYWECLDEIPDHRLWSLRQELKSLMFKSVGERYRRQLTRAGFGDAFIDKATGLLDPLNPQPLVIGFARRFATYKRAALLFSQPERLAALLGNPERPVVIILAGKAHPADEPGQELIRTIFEFSRQPQFLGKVILVEGYDMALARKLVSGVDVWLNTPEYPMEASGTSGEKAAINGVLNLSVLDGWWGEGYNGQNGWAILPHEVGFDPGSRDRAEGNDLFNILEEQVVPTYYARANQGFSSAWVNLARASMKSILPQYNSVRMVMDYLRDFYVPAMKHQRLMSANEGAAAETLASWKTRIRSLWPGVSLRLLAPVPPTLFSSESLTVQVVASLNGLTADDVQVECLFGQMEEGEFASQLTFRMASDESPDEALQPGDHLFKLDEPVTLSGLQQLKIRIYPFDPVLAHPFETGCMIWL
ncbi:MAG: alpha-glucan family phosphorylase [Gammaproteobacteria bacterium]|nr:alpha-glucan family phosphorylase [Gammaproteobacteria bacterium]